MHGTHEEAEELHLLQIAKHDKEVSPREIRVLLESESLDTQEVQETIRKQVFDE